MELKGFGARARDTAWSRVAMSLALVLLMLGVVLVSSVEPAIAAATSDIRKTKHNLSKNAPSTNTTKSTTEDQVCVFCHTPHAATAGVNPLWNRSVSTSGYTRYNSLSLDANYTTDGYSAQPGGSSVLCLSCHDGQVALGNVNVLNGQPDAKISVNGSTTTTMPTGSGTSSGFTRHLGTDLSNDHPISITYDDALADRDGELAAMSDTAPLQRDTGTSGDLIGIRNAATGYKPKLPLQATGAGGVGQVQCGTCHDPHLYDATDTNRRFLRLRRLQSDTNPTATFSEANDILCLACHTKLGTSWAYSAHADKDVANETYSDTTAAGLRGFPTTTKVSNAACLNCHDTHTKQGARRLLREGADGSNASAMEETCYQCHSATKIISGTLTSATNTATTNLVPDIKTDFNITNGIRMPITGTEVHDIGGNFNDTGFVDCTGSTSKCGADMIEQQLKLGSGALGNRHVECTDCHNPHRVRRNSKFYGVPGDGNSDKRTHDVGSANAAGAINGNVASGVLRGSWGVEPTYAAFTTSSVWPNAPTGFDVKRGDPSSSDTGKGNGYLTREYQLCFKCHSNYAVNGAFPALGGTGKTASGTNSMSNYTNIAAEMSYKAEDGTTLASLTGSHQCEADNDTACTPIGAGGWDTTANAAKNHRSWHPVKHPTGRTAVERGGSSSDSNFRVPFKSGLGLQTMYCSDCHGNSGGVNATTGTTGANSWIQDTGPNPRRTQGPHGSNSNFLLKGTWDPATNTPGDPGMCGNCHVGNVSYQNSGWGVSGIDSSGHASSEHNKRCGRCHIAVPHGWKNKAFLVNNNCIGAEGGAGGNCVEADAGPLSGYDSTNGDNEGLFTKGPYYIGASLRVKTWQSSRNWGSDGSCGPPSGTAGKDWMTNTC